MRLWSLHPQYLDTRGLTALWREGLLAQAVLTGKTRGYTHHPQLNRFREAASPQEMIAAYLHIVHDEATKRGYNFDRSKLTEASAVENITVTEDQLDYEWTHLRNKLQVRAPDLLARFESVARPEPHPLFYVIPGAVADWEIIMHHNK